MSLVSAVPAALDALVTLTRAAPAFANVLIIDGPPLQKIGPGKTVLIIGGSPDPEDLSAASAVLVDASMAAGDVLEVIDIPCHVEHWQGGKDIKAARDAAYAVVSAVAALCAANRNLGGAVRRARVTGSHELGQARYDGEVGAAVPFTVRCEVL